jgi:2-desacetyl-2-hydroxyethyl bacteriochlorophyllide A dehydrogenase
MRAVRFYGPGKPLEIEDLAEPKPGPDEVVVRVAACGVCASDLHIIDGSLPTQTPVPITMGHEPSGVVAEAGTDVSGWNPGDRVVLTAGKRCGVCPRCRDGRGIEECRLPLMLGINYDGAWAEKVVVPASSLVRLPDVVPMQVGAILADAVGTPFNAVTDAGGLRPGERIAVFGVGGLGTHAVQIARLSGAAFIAAVDPLASARERARGLGADLVVDPTAENASSAIRAATDGEGVDLAVECVGSNAVLKQAVASLAIDGRAVIVGVGGEPIQLGPSALFALLRNRLLSVMGYRRHHLETLVRLVASGRLDLTKSISATLPLEQANDAVAMLAEKRGDPVRILLMP